MNRSDTILTALVCCLAAGIVATIAVGSGWMWILFGALGLVLLAAAVSNRHWATAYRWITGVLGVVCLAISIVPWIDMFAGYTAERIP